jgi:Zn-dependent protease
MLSNSLIDPLVLLPKIVILLFAFPLHELAHAVTADWLGDDTPRRQGRLTLNPLAHLDVYGSLLLLLGTFGWAKPVYTNPYNFRNGPRAGTAMVALAGPLMNLVLAVVGALTWRALDGFGGSELIGRNAFSNLTTFADVFVSINLYLMLFNLLPFGPLDGMKVLRGLAPNNWDGALDQLERWGMFILIALIFLPFVAGINILGIVLGGPFEFFYRLVFGL